MKKYIFVLISFAFISFCGVASTTGNSEKLATNVSQVNNFTLDLGDITNKTEDEIAKTINEYLDVNLTSLPVLQCSVTVSAKLTIPKIAEFNISVTVSGDCNEVKSQGKEIANQLISDISEFLKNYYIL